MEPWCLALFLAAFGPRWAAPLGGAIPLGGAAHTERKHAAARAWLRVCASREIGGGGDDGGGGAHALTHFASILSPFFSSAFHLSFSQPVVQRKLVGAAAEADG